MKTSNRILLSLFAITIATMIGSNYVLSEQLKNFDFIKSLNHYVEEELPPFSVILLKRENENGRYVPNHVQIKKAEIFKIKISKFNEGVTDWKVKDDTLIISIKSDSIYIRKNMNEYDYTQSFATISLPKLKAIHVTNINTRLIGFQDANLNVILDKSKMELTYSTFDTFRANVNNQSALVIDAVSQFQKATIVVEGFSSLKIFKDNFQSLDFNIADSSSIQLPGSMFNDFTK